MYSTNVSCTHYVLHKVEGPGDLVMSRYHFCPYKTLSVPGGQDRNVYQNVLIYIKPFTHKHTYSSTVTKSKEKKKR